MIALTAMTDKKRDAQTHKVKMSVFLEPEVARAAKVQAARQGAGISEVVRNFFVCGHCDEPITDEFAVGIKVTPGSFRVFFHANRDECRVAGGLPPKRKSR